MMMMSLYPLFFFLCSDFGSDFGSNFVFFPFVQSYFIKLFDAALQCKFVQTFKKGTNVFGLVGPQKGVHQL